MEISILWLKTIEKNLWKIRLFIVPYWPKNLHHIETVLLLLPLAHFLSHNDQSQYFLVSKINIVSQKRNNNIQLKWCWNNSHLLIYEFTKYNSLAKDLWRCMKLDNNVLLVFSVLCCSPSLQLTVCVQCI